MTKKSFEVSLTFQDPDGLRLPLMKAALQANHVQVHEMIEQLQNGKHVLSIYRKNSTSALKLKNRLRSLKFKKVVVAYHAIADKDWQNVWKEEYRPFALTPHFYLVPFSHKKTFQAGRREPLFIDTSFAFGTGMHATTKFMAEFIDQSRGKFFTFMDIGTGTGILSILAAKCGAEELCSIDLSRDIIKIARMNFKENNVPANGLRAVNFEQLKMKRKFDYVAANLITQDLIFFKKKILSFVKPGGYLAVSGISLKNYTLLREEFKTLPLKCLKIKKGEGWVGILFKRQRT